MTRTTRRIVFYFLAFAFAVVGPAAVLYALGYTYRPDTATFETTGGIFIKSATPRTSVFQDGAFVRETGFLTGSTLLTDVVPGTHRVRLEKEGYRSWSKTAAVEPGAVTEFRSVILLPRAAAPATSTLRELASVRATTTPLAGFSRDAKGHLQRTEGMQREPIAENIHSFIARSDDIIFVGDNGFLARYDPSSRATETIGRPGFFLADTPFIFSDGARFAAIIDSAGGLFLYEADAKTVRPAGADVKSAFFDGEETRLLIVMENKIDILWLRDNDRQPFQKKGDTEQIVQEVHPIREARWYYGTDAHAVYRTRAGVFIVEADTRGGGNVQEIIAGPVDEIITSPLAPNTIFYRKEKGVYKIEL